MGILMDVKQGLLGNGRHQPRPPPEGLDTLESVGRLSGKRQTKEEDQRPWRELQRFESGGEGQRKAAQGLSFCDC